MNAGRMLFISSAFFSITISVGYWFVAHEILGTFMLGVMAFGFTFVAGYMLVAEREADLWGDQPDATMLEAAGQVIGTYTIRSPLPFWTGVAIASLLLGLVISPMIAVLALIALVALGAAFIIQSR